MNRLFWICAAGATGTAARYLIGLWAGQRFGASFPYGTLIVNVSGCFLIAALMHLALVNGWPATVRVAVTIGFLGGFTTYSSFNYETMRLMEEGAAATALANVLLTLLGGFGAGWLGLLLARQLAGR
jgi:CrcB protein